MIFMGLALVHFQKYWLLSSSNWFGLLFSSQNWINFENIPKNSDFLMDFDNFCSLFECHSILAEKQRTKKTNYSSLSFFASLDTQDTFQGGITVEWKKFWQEIPVCEREMHEIFWPYTLTVWKAIYRKTKYLDQLWRSLCLRNCMLFSRLFLHHK